MSGLNRVTRRRTAVWLLALMSGVWLLAAAAPCVMAAPCTGMGDAPCQPADSASPPDCDALQAVDCQSGDLALTERVSVPDSTALPPRLQTLAPVPFRLPRSVPPRDAERYALRLSSPPLYLQHSVFLI